METYINGEATIKIELVEKGNDHNGVTFYWNDLKIETYPNCDVSPIVAINFNCIQEIDVDNLILSLKEVKKELVKRNKKYSDMEKANAKLKKLKGDVTR